jgi:hypothetical protein
MDWPRSFLASSLWFGMTLTPGNRSARLVTFLTERSSYTLRLLSRSLAAWRFNGPEPRESALSLGFIYLVFALLWVPHIVAEPRVFDRWGNFFEQFSLVSGALIVYASPNPRDSQQPATLARLGYLFFGICVVSFTLEQLFYLSGTAAFVPKWIPPGQMFWAIVTTIAFVLAAIALLSGRSALLAARLLTAMLIGFGLLVWLPAPFADPHKMINWAGNA